MNMQPVLEEITLIYQVGFEIKLSLSVLIKVDLNEKYYILSILLFTSFCIIFQDNLFSVPLWNVLGILIISKPNDYV